MTTHSTAIPADVSLWDYRCDFIKNRDGDSVTLLLDRGFGDYKNTQDGVRLSGVYAPELDQVGGAACRDFVRDWFLGHSLTSMLEEAVTLWPLMVRTSVTARGRERQTFGRYIGIVWAPGDPVSLNDAVNTYVVEQGFSRGTGYRPPA